jgi:hypothetical protein
MAMVYKKLAVEASEKVAILAAEYATNPDSDVWCRLENANRQWTEYHNIWRAMACHKL